MYVGHLQASGDSRGVQQVPFAVCCKISSGALLELRFMLSWVVPSSNLLTSLKRACVNILEGFLNILAGILLPLFAAGERHGLQLVLGAPKLWELQVFPDSTATIAQGSPLGSSSSCNALDSCLYARNHTQELPVPTSLLNCWTGKCPCNGAEDMSGEVRGGLWNCVFLRPLWVLFGLVVFYVAGFPQIVPWTLRKTCFGWATSFSCASCVVLKTLVYH